MGGWGSLIPPNFSAFFLRRTLSTYLYTTYKNMIYNCTIMTIIDWLGLILTSLSILTIIGVSIRWVIKHYVADILKELKPNGGSSLKDQVNRLEDQVAKIEKSSEEADFKRREMSVKLDHLYDLFVDYLANNQKSSGTAKSKKTEK